MARIVVDLLLTKCSIQNLNGLCRGLFSSPSVESSRIIPPLMEFPHVHLPHLRHTLRYITLVTHKLIQLSILFRIRFDLAILETFFLKNYLDQLHKSFLYRTYMFLIIYFTLYHTQAFSAKYLFCPQLGTVFWIRIDLAVLEQIFFFFLLFGPTA